jgi:hypothetical protein
VTSIKKSLSTAAMAAVLGVGVLAATVGSASAYVVCSNAGDCWHADQRYTYGPELGIQVHPDDWYFHHDWTHDNAHYRGGVWIGL